MLVRTALAAWAARVDGVPLAVDLALGLVAVAVLPFLRGHPLAGGLLLGVLAALSPAAPPAATAGTYVVARRERLGIAVPAACASIVGHAVQALWRSVGLPVGWWLLCDVAVHAALLGWAPRPHPGCPGRPVAGARPGGRAGPGAQGRGGAVGGTHPDRPRDARHPRAPTDPLADHRGRRLWYRTDLSPEQVAAAAGVVRASAGEALDDLRTVIGVLREGPDELRPRRGCPTSPRSRTRSAPSGRS